MQLSSLFRGLVHRATGPVTAPFSTSFTNATEGNRIQLQWGAIDASMYPLAISVRLINRTDNGMANGLQMNLAASVDHSNFTWESPPSPLPYLGSALYAVEIRPARWNATEASPVLVKSDFFAIAQQKQKTGATGSQSPNPPANSNAANGSTNNSSGPAGPNTTAIAVGLAVGIPVIIAAGFLLHLLRKKRRTVQDEVMKKRKAELIID